MDCIGLHWIGLDFRSNCAQMGAWPFFFFLAHLTPKSSRIVQHLQTVCLIYVLIFVK